MLFHNLRYKPKKASDTNYVSMGKGGTGRYELLSVEDGVVYDVRARAINALNVRSAFNTQSHQVVGKTLPPADVTNFQVNIIGTEAHLSWTPVADLDLSHYIIRHSPLTSGAIFTNATTLIDKGIKTCKYSNSSCINWNIFC